MRSALSWRASWCRALRCGPSLSPALSRGRLWRLRSAQLHHEQAPVGLCVERYQKEERVLVPLSASPTTHHPAAPCTSPNPRSTTPLRPQTRDLRNARMLPPTHPHANPNPNGAAVFAALLLLNLSGAAIRPGGHHPTHTHSTCDFINPPWVWVRVCAPRLLAKNLKPAQLRQ